MQSNADIYENLFLAAREDVRQMEKQAIAGGAARAGTDFLNQAGVNKLPGAKALNESEFGKLIADLGDRLTGQVDNSAQTSKMVKNDPLKQKTPEEFEQELMSEGMSESEKKYIRTGEKPKPKNPPEQSPNSGPSPGSSSGGLSRGAATAGAAGTAGLAGTGGYLYGQKRTEDEWRKNRNMAFGAGLATGTAAPKIYDHASNAVQSFLNRGGSNVQNQ